MSLGSTPEKPPVEEGAPYFAWVLSSIAILVFSVFTASCIYVPVSKKVTQGEEVTDEQLAQLKPGVNTREDVIRQLGQPWFDFKTHPVIAYLWNVREGYVESLAIDGPFSGGGYVEGKYALLIEFDESNVIRRLEKLRRPYSVQDMTDFVADWVAKGKKTSPADRKSKGAEK